MSEVIQEEELPITVVISIQENFLAELDIFRNHYSEWFNNYYRLQDLAPEQAREAILGPVMGYGYAYEADLIETLIIDLSFGGIDIFKKEKSRRIAAPYLQIVCENLWQNVQKDYVSNKKIISKEIYYKLGGAKGIVENLLENILNNFSFKEKHLVSKLFSFLAVRSGVNMALPENKLAELTRIKKENLLSVLNKLVQIHILRKERFSDEYWYSISNNIFSNLIYEWNVQFQRKKRTNYKIILSVTFLTFSLASMLFLFSFLIK